MQPFTIRVLGGSFTVQEVLSQNGPSEQETIDLMMTIPPDRWFVILDENPGGESRDALALIDDDLQFQSLAVGNFEGEE